MPIKSLLLSLAPFLLLLVYMPLAASIQCFPIPPSELGKQDTFTFAGSELPRPVAADCLHIISQFPSSLHVDPSTQAAHERLTLNYGRLAGHRFDFPALFTHRTCEVFISTYIREPNEHRGSNRQESAFYFWNILKSSAQNIVNKCLQNQRYWGGEDRTYADTMGFTQETLQTSQAEVMVTAAGYVRRPDAGLHVYSV